MTDLKIKLSPSFFNEEKLCDYFVDSKMKRTWAVELDLMAELFRVCNKHNIRIMAFGGTLLGAVRHHGFIPWDDDMDFCLDRKDFEKLLSVSNEFEHPYFLQTARSDTKYFFGYARLRNSETTSIIEWNKSTDYNNGIYIDIFVMDGFLDDKRATKKQIRKRENAIRIINLFKNDYRARRGIKKLFVFLLNKTFCKLYSLEKALLRYEKALSMYTERSSKLSIMTHGSVFFEKYWIYKESFNDLIFLDFEGFKIPAPKDYDEILKHTYGDYMAFPPVEKRGDWHAGILTIDPDTPYKVFLSRENQSAE